MLGSGSRILFSGDLGIVKNMLDGPIKIENYFLPEVGVGENWLVHCMVNQRRSKRPFWINLLKKLVEFYVIVDKGVDKRLVGEEDKFAGVCRYLLIRDLFWGHHCAVF